MFVEVKNENLQVCQKDVMIFYYWKKNVNSIISNRREGFVMQIETYSGKASMTEWEKLQA